VKHQSNGEEINGEGDNRNENFQNGSPGELHIRNQTSNETAWKTNKNQIKLKTQKRHIK